MNRRHFIWLVSALLGLAGLWSLVLWPGRVQPDAPATATAIVQALTSGDKVGFTSQFSTEADQQRVQLLWTNLQYIELLSLSANSADSWQVGWRVPGESGVATNLIAAKWHCSPVACRLTDLQQHPGSPTPIWLTGTIQTYQVGQTVLIGAPGVQRWAEAAQQSADQLPGLTTDLAGLLRSPEVQVIELPADKTGFEQLLAAPATDFAGTGAITWAADSGGATELSASAPTRIVLNPDATADLDEQARLLLLLHERVHAATAWLGPPAAGQLWVSEGLAEQVMARAWSAQPLGNQQSLGHPCSPPADADFTNRATWQCAYAWAADTVGQIVATDPEQVIWLWQHSGAQPQLA